MDIGHIINLIVNAITLNLTNTLSRQMQKLSGNNPRSGIGGFFDRILPQTGRSWSDRLNSAFSVSHGNPERESALRTIWAEKLSAQANMKEQGEKYGAAQKELADEQKTPTGKSIPLLTLAVDAAKINFDKASKAARELSDSYEQLKTAVQRMTKWETERERLHKWTPTALAHKFRQSVRVAGRQISRWRDRMGWLKASKIAFAKAQQTHAANRVGFRRAMSAYRRAKAAGDPTAIAATRKVAVAAGQTAIASRGNLEHAAKNVVATAAGLHVASKGALMGIIGAAMRFAGPVALAVTAVTTMIGLSVGFVQRQIAASQEKIEHIFRQRTGVNSTYAQMVMMYDISNRLRQIRIAQGTAGTARMLTESTTQLQEKAAPFQVAFENLSNIVQTGFNHLTMFGIDVLDILLKMQLGIDLKSINEALQKLLGAGGNQNPGMRTFWDAEALNEQNRGKANMQPLVPPLRRR